MNFKLVHNKEDSKGLFTELLEEWADIKDFEGHYQISNLGQVKSLARMRLSARGSMASMKERILVQKVTKQGYHIIGLHNNEIRKFTPIHRLVALHFIENTENKPTVNHIDGNKKNNTVWNLEWNTVKENTTHAFDTGLAQKRGHEKYSIAFKKEVKEYFDLTGCSIAALSEHFGISNRSAGRFSKGVFGEVNNAVLRNKTEEIIAMRKAGYTLKAVGDVFGISISHVHRITNGFTSEAKHER